MLLAPWGIRSFDSVPIAIWRYYKAYLKVRMGFRPQTRMEIHAWCYKQFIAMWHRPCPIIEGTLREFITGSSEAKQGLLYLLTRSQLGVALNFFLWPLIALVRSRKKNLDGWLRNWVIAIYRPDLFLSVGVGPFEIDHISTLPSALLHICVSTYEFNIASKEGYRFENKEYFCEVLKQRGFTVPKIIKPHEIDTQQLYILKPKQSTQGKGVSLASGAELKSLKLAETHLIQERLSNHPSIAHLVGKDAGLSTARMATISNGDDQIIIFGGFFRLSSNGVVVDNFHAGGIACRVDCRTGMLGFGMRDLEKQSNWSKPMIDRHPETHVVFAEQFYLPDFQKAKEICIQAHQRLCNDLFFVSWDIAFTPEGPCLIEMTSCGGALELFEPVDYEVYMETLSQRVFELTKR